MKNNLKKFTKFLFATLILVGCSEDLYDGTPETKTNLKIEKVKFKDLKTSSNKILSKTINSLVEYKKTATTNKLVYDEIYNFYIDEENGVSVNLNGKESYTFPIFKSQSDGTVENIVFNENENGDFSIILADYSLTKDELDNLDHSLNEGDVQYYDMSKFGATELVCVDMITTIYGKCDHTHSNGYTCEPEIVTQSYCSWVTSDGAGGGGNPDGAGGSNTGGNGSTGGSGGISGGGVITSPNPGLTTAQYQLLSQLNTTAGETFYSFDETVTANVLNYIESISSNNQLINSIAYFLNNTNTLWLSNQTTQTQQSIFNYLIANGFSTASKNKIKQLINYFIQNPSMSSEQFANWFLGTVEGKDSFYDESFWQNSNLNFPQQQLPTWNNFNNSFPRNSNGTFMIGADNVFGYVGGAVQQARIDNPNDTNNTCALKVSIALNGSGVVIPNIPGQTLQGGGAFAGKFFFLNAKALNNWMKLTFGTNPNNPNHHQFNQNQGGTNGEGFITALNSLSPNHGIFTMLPISAIEFGASGHCDIFDGTNCASHCYFDSASEINIWILP